MSLDDAKASLEALPGVYDVSMWVRHMGHNRTLDHVEFSLRIASPELIPEETRQGILRIWETLERELRCFVFVAVSAGLRMPNS